MIDIVTVVFDEEIPVLRAQAQSIALYCKKIGIRNIYVVLNDEETVAAKIDPAWWGEFASAVLVVPRSTFSTEFVQDGWVSQQVLKILAASMSYNTWSMVLDAKTIFVRELDPRDITDEQGRMCVGTQDIYPVFEPSRLIINQLYNIDLKQQLGPGGVPFFFQNDAVRLMIAETTFITGQSFPHWFQARGRITEFMLYAGYLQHRFKGFDTFYNQRSSFGLVNVCHSEVAAWDQKIAQMKTMNPLTVSVHRRAWSQLDSEQQQQFQYFLIEHGITQAWQL
jgi:hypothetical protein